MTIAAFYEALTSVVDHQPWRERAACKDLDASLFYPERGDSIVEAKRTCASCEVREECLAHAMEMHEGFGIWGGTSERQRRRMRHGQAVTVHVLTPAEVDTKRRIRAWQQNIAELRTQRNRRRGA